MYIYIYILQSMLLCGRDRHVVSSTAPCVRVPRPKTPYAGAVVTWPGNYNARAGVSATM